MVAMKAVTVVRSWRWMTGKPVAVVAPEVVWSQVGAGWTEVVPQASARRVLVTATSRAWAPVAVVNAVQSAEVRVHLMV